MEPVERMRQLLEIMAQNDLAEIELEEPDLRIKIRKNGPVQAFPAGLSFAPLQNSLSAPPALQPPTEAASEATQLGQAKTVEIASPMVGTFYRSPTPGAEPYVSMGSEIDAETVICIIEAMKVMNEIKAEVSGTVVEILVQDGEPIEFGQVLFLVQPGEAGQP